jgi:hypothetical protein
LALSLNWSIETLLNASRFTDSISEVIKLGPTDFTTTDNLNTGNSGRMEQEYPLYPNALKDFPDGNGFVNATISLGNNYSFVGLNPFFTPFNDFNAHFDSIANVDGGEVLLYMFCFNEANHLLRVHRFSQNSQFTIVSQDWEQVKGKYGRSKLDWLYL